MGYSNQGECAALLTRNESGSIPLIPAIPACGVTYIIKRKRTRGL